MLSWIAALFLEGSIDFKWKVSPLPKDIKGNMISV